VDVLNVRSKPTTSATVVGKLTRGAKVGILDVTGTDIWLKIDEGQFICARLGQQVFVKINSGL
jgi:uncharacterized protein YgiM (DUF1202 family)